MTDNIFETRDGASAHCEYSSGDHGSFLADFAPTYLSVVFGGSSAFYNALVFLSS